MPDDLPLSTIHKFKLNLTAGAAGSSVEMDGKPLPNVRSIRVQCGIGRATRVLVEFVAVDVEVEAAGELRKISSR